MIQSKDKTYIRFIYNVQQCGNVLTRKVDNTLLKNILNFVFASIVICILPVAMLTLTHRNRKVTTYSKLETYLYEKWKSESAIVALAELRGTYNKILSHKNLELEEKDIVVEPFGKFTPDDIDALEETLYRYEVQLKNWVYAIKLCNRKIEDVEQDRRYDAYNRTKHLEKWYLRKIDTHLKASQFKHAVKVATEFERDYKFSDHALDKLRGAIGL